MAGRRSPDPTSLDVHPRGDHAGRGADRRTGIGMSSRPTRACVGLSELLPKLPDPFPDRRARHGELLDTPSRPEHVPSPPVYPTGLAGKGWKTSGRGRVALRQGCPGGSADRGHNLVPWYPNATDLRGTVLCRGGSGDGCGIGVSSVLMGFLFTCLRAPRDRPGAAAPRPRIKRGM
jgi:hypothetical protein